MTSQNDVISALEDVQDALAKAGATISKVMASIEGTSGNAGDAPPDWLQPRLKMFKAIKDKGGDVKDEELQKFASTLGYKKLSGFYHGKKAGLIKLSGNRTALTKAAEQRLEEWSEWVATLPKL
jgi:hypothetical protein